MDLMVCVATMANQVLEDWLEDVEIKVILDLVFLDVKVILEDLVWME